MNMALWFLDFALALLGLETGTGTHTTLHMVSQQLLSGQELHNFWGHGIHKAKRAKQGRQGQGSTTTSMIFYLPGHMRASPTPPSITHQQTFSLLGLGHLVWAGRHSLLTTCALRQVWHCLHWFVGTLYPPSCTLFAWDPPP